MQTAASRTEPGNAFHHAVIVGGGIAGLAAAVALKQIGWRSTVLERSTELLEQGAGIALWPNAVHALTALGLHPPLAEVSAIQDDARLRTWRGAPLGPPLGAQFQDEFGAPLLMAHRAALQQLLLQAADPGALRMGSTCVAVEQVAGRACAHIEGHSHIEGEILIAADGLHSAIRWAIVGGVASKYSGCTAWRGVVPVDEAVRPRLATGEFLGPGALFGIASLQGSQVYWWASRRCPENPGGRPAQEKRQLLEHYGRWADPIPDLLDATPAEAIIRTPLYIFPPLRNLSVGRIGLVGDAAHPMMPSLGQGACQAIEDAAELAQALTAESNVTAALDAYSIRRAPRTALVVRRSQQITRVATLGNPLLTWLRNSILRSTSASSAMRLMAPVVGYRMADHVTARRGKHVGPTR